MWFVKYMFSGKIWFTKTSTRIAKSKLWVVKLNSASQILVYTLKFSNYSTFPFLSSEKINQEEISDTAKRFWRFYNLYYPVVFNQSYLSWEFVDPGITLCMAFLKICHQMLLCSGNILGGFFIFFKI